MATILVTGGAGFIGSHLVDALLAGGHRVTALDDLSTGRTENLRQAQKHPAFRYVSGSAADSALLSELCAGVEQVYHLAAAVGVALVNAQPVDSIQRNIEPTRLLLAELARRHNAGEKVKLFLASSSEVYGRNPKPQWTENDDLVFGPTTRPRWSYGMVLPRFIESARTGEPLQVYGDGTQTRCFAHVSDVVAAVLSLMQSPAAVGQIFNIGSDQPISIRTLAERVIERTQSSSTIKLCDYTAVFDAEFEDVAHRIPDITRLRSIHGWQPQFSLDAIIDDIIGNVAK